jgi:hypothetical protein
MPLVGLDDLTVRLREQVIAETKCLVERAGLRIGAPIGGDSDERAQRKRRNTESCFAENDAIKPSAT